MIDSEIKGEVFRQQLEEPEYSEARGISIVHFAVADSGSHEGQWMMLGNPGGKDSASILESDKSRLSKSNQARIEVSGRPPFHAMISWRSSGHVLKKAVQGIRWGFLQMWIRFTSSVR